MIIDQFRIGFGKGTSKKWVIPTCLYLVSDKMRLKSFDFLLFAKLPNWHEEWCMLWWLPSSIQFLRANAMLSLFTTSTSTVKKEKSTLLFAGRITNGDLPALPARKKNPRKFNAISAHELFDLKVTVEVKWDFLISIQDDLDAQTLIIWKYYLILVKLHSRIHTKWDILQWFSTTIRSIFPSAIFDSFIHIKCNCSSKNFFFF